MNKLSNPSLSTATHRLEALLNARSVAIVGASTDPLKITGRPIAYMQANGYTGNIYPVNPGRTEVQGLKCYPSISAISEPVDLAIIGTAAANVEAYIQEGIAAGVKAFVVFSSGFAELDESGRAMQERLTALAQAHNVAIVGPNCLGVANSRSGLIATFTTALESHELLRGNFSFISQSGALGAYWMDIVLRNSIGFAQWITTGNECNVDVAEAIDFLVDDPDTQVIGLYLEDARNTRALRRSLERAALAGKPVIAIKAGSSQAGAAAAASHTGALAGDDALYDTCLKQYGALRVDSLTEMMDAARLLLHNATPLGPQLLVMSVSGGAGVLIADACEPHNIQLPELKPEIKEALRPVIPSFVHPNNPLDITGHVLQDTPMIARAMRTVSADKDLNAIVLFIGMMHSIADSFVDALAEARRSIHCPIIVIWVGAMDESIQTLEHAGIPVFLDIPQATTAMARCLWLSKAHRTIQERGSTPLPAPTVGAARALAPLSEWQGKQLLRQHKALPLPQSWLLQPGDPCPVAATFPLVAKLQAPDLLHKSDAGGVILHINDASALEAAVHKLHDIGRTLKLQMEGVLVEPMLAYDHELLLGLRQDLLFGPVLTLARGGVEAELDPDVVNLLLPASAQDVEQALESLRCAALLHGYRGRPAADIPAISQHIAKLCAWFEQQALREVEINPLVVKGDQIFALDALITPTQ